MSVERENACINNQIFLRTNFKYSQTGDLFNPSAISKVEILDSDGESVLETFTGASIVQDSTGKYHVLATAITSAKTIYDKWYFTPAAGAGEITKTNACIVWATAGEAGTTAVDTTPAGMLAAINALIGARLVGGAVHSYSIGGRNLQKASLQELYEIRDRLRAEVADLSGSARNYAGF